MCGLDFERPTKITSFRRLGRVLEPLGRIFGRLNGALERLGRVLECLGGVWETS